MRRSARSTGRSTWSVLVVALVAATARRAFVVITVTGNSMAPAFVDGDRLLVFCGARRAFRPRRGTVAVFRSPTVRRPGPPDLEWLVKRVTGLPGDPVPADVRGAAGQAAVIPPGRLLVRGDNPDSLDSRHFGFVPVADVLGIAVRRMTRPQPTEWPSAPTTRQT